MSGTISSMKKKDFIINSSNSDNFHNIRKSSCEWCFFIQLKMAGKRLHYKHIIIINNLL
jgi:hypothetical protein